jgi:hypothetical protein
MPRGQHPRLYASPHHPADQWQMMDHGKRYRRVKCEFAKGSAVASSCMTRALLSSSGQPDGKRNRNRFRDARERAEVARKTFVAILVMSGLPGSAKRTSLPRRRKSRGAAPSSVR